MSDPPMTPKPIPEAVREVCGACHCMPHAEKSAGICIACDKRVGCVCAAILAHEERVRERVRAERDAAWLSALIEQPQPGDSPMLVAERAFERVRAEERERCEPDVLRSAASDVPGSSLWINFRQWLLDRADAREAAIRGGK